MTGAIFISVILLMIFLMMKATILMRMTNMMTVTTMTSGTDCATAAATATLQPGWPGAPVAGIGMILIILNRMIVSS